MTKSEQIAKILNANTTADFRQVAEAKAAEIGVGIYWAGTASQAPKNTRAEVWQMRNGEVVRGFDGIWRA